MSASAVQQAFRGGKAKVICANSVCSRAGINVPKDGVGEVGRGPGSQWSQGMLGYRMAAAVARGSNVHAMRQHADS